MSVKVRTRIIIVSVRKVVKDWKKTKLASSNLLITYLFWIHKPIFNQNVHSWGIIPLYYANKI